MAERWLPYEMRPLTFSENLSGCLESLGEQTDAMFGNPQVVAMGVV